MKKVYRVRMKAAWVNGEGTRQHDLVVTAHSATEAVGMAIERVQDRITSLDAFGVDELAQIEVEELDNTEVVVL